MPAIWCEPSGEARCGPIDLLKTSRQSRTFGAWLIVLMPGKCPKPLQAHLLSVTIIKSNIDRSRQQISWPVFPRNFCWPRAVPWNRDAANASSSRTRFKVSGRKVSGFWSNPPPHSVRKHWCQSRLSNLVFAAESLQPRCDLHTPAQSRLPVPTAAKPCVVRVAATNPTWRRRIHERNNDVWRVKNPSRVDRSE